MKLRLTVLAFLTISGVPGFAIDQVFLEPVTPISTVLKAQGGVSTANAEGFDALFANPASFADSKISLTLFDMEATAQSSLSGLQRVLDARAQWPTIMGILSPGNTMLPLVSDLVAHGGVGAEVSPLRLGWVGANLGVGLVVQSRVSLTGANLLDAKGTFDHTYAGVIGMGWPFDVGMGTLKLGGALRPMQRSYAKFGVGDLLANGMDTEAYSIQSGFGLGWDLGVRWDYAGFKTGFVVRDLGSTVFGFREYSLAKWASQLSFPAGGSTAGSTLYRIPTVIALGTNWVPDMGTLSSLFQPSLSMDFQIPIKDEFSQPSFWTWTHLGLEAKFLQMLSIRTGLNQGFLTFGMGAKISIVEFNFAIYSDELGRYSGTIRRPALSTNFAIRL